MAMRVVLEREIEPHDAGLYSADADRSYLDCWRHADSLAVEKYHNQGYVVVSGGFDDGAMTAARDELAAMTLADDPRCESVYYESSIAAHLGGTAPNAADHSGTGANPTLSRLALGTFASDLPAVEPGLRAQYVRKFMGFLDDHPALAAIAKHRELLEFVTRIVEGPVRVFQDMAMIKPPGGREKPWHQDHAYFNLPLNTPVVGVWIALDAVAPANGCMYVEPGGHRHGPVPHFLRRDWQICDREIASRRVVALPMQAGDILIFDSKLPHGTPRNTTSQHRWALQFHYVPAEVVECDDETRLAAFGSEGKDASC